MRDPSLETEKPSPFPKVVVLLPWGSPSTTLGAILSSNTMHDLFGPIQQRKFQFHGMIVWTIHDA